ncbi:MAG TPA: DUF3574 domain-containing protein [bacterium]|nr:DUF3574 domain-containing protein [bacterium]
MRQLFILTLSLLLCWPMMVSAQVTPQATAVSIPNAPYLSDTLAFGTQRAHGGSVTSKEWEAFLKTVITPLFPEGLTTWEAKGQWQEKDGSVSHEKSEMLLLIHKDTPVDNRSIQKIIDLYKSEFDQESVMWVRNKVLVSF